MESNNRPSWEEYFKVIVENTATRSPCHRLKVGCLLTKDNRIISQGYNGFLPGAPHESIVENNHEQATVHAEQNAIADCAKRGTSCDGCTVYITHYPCTTTSGRGCSSRSSSTVLTSMASSNCVQVLRTWRLPRSSNASLFGAL